MIRKIGLQKGGIVNKLYGKKYYDQGHIQERNYQKRNPGKEKIKMILIDQQKLRRAGGSAQSRRFLLNLVFYELRKIWEKVGNNKVGKGRITICNITVAPQHLILETKFVSMNNMNYPFFLFLLLWQQSVRKAVFYKPKSPLFWLKGREYT